MIRTTILACTSFLLLACSAAEQDAAPPSDAIDLIVAGDYVVTMDAGLTVIEDGAVAVDDGVIIAVGPAGEISSQYVRRWRHWLVMAGLSCPGSLTATHTPPCRCCAASPTILRSWTG